MIILRIPLNFIFIILTGSAHGGTPLFPSLQNMIFTKQFLMKALSRLEAFDFLISDPHNTNKNKSLCIRNHNRNNNNINNYKRHTKNMHGNSIKNCALGLIAHCTSI